MFCEHARDRRLDSRPTSTAGESRLGARGRCRRQEQRPGCRVCCRGGRGAGLAGHGPWPAFGLRSYAIVRRLARALAGATCRMHATLRPAPLRGYGAAADPTSPRPAQKASRVTPPSGPGGPRDDRGGTRPEASARSRNIRRTCRAGPGGHACLTPHVQMASTVRRGGVCERNGGAPAGWCLRVLRAGWCWRDGAAWPDGACGSSASAPAAGPWCVSHPHRQLVHRWIGAQRALSLTSLSFSLPLYLSLADRRCVQDGVRGERNPGDGTSKCLLSPCEPARYATQRDGTGK